MTTIETRITSSFRLIPVITFEEAMKREGIYRPTMASLQNYRLLVIYSSEGNKPLLVGLNTIRFLGTNHGWNIPECTYVKVENAELTINIREID